MMKILVTGGCGFIGSNFIRYFLETHPEDQVINVDKLTYAGNLESLSDISDPLRYRFVRGDIADAPAMEALISEGVDGVVNFAAESHVDRSIQDPGAFIRTNIFGTFALDSAGILCYEGPISCHPSTGSGRTAFVHGSSYIVHRSGHGSTIP